MSILLASIENMHDNYRKQKFLPSKYFAYNEQIYGKNDVFNIVSCKIFSACV